MSPRHCSHVLTTHKQKTVQTLPQVIDQQTRLPSLVDDRSWLVFQPLGVDPSCWVKQPVVKWKEDAGFLEYQRFVKDL